MNKQEIEKIIPHRDPYLMLDEVNIDKEGEKGRGFKKFRIDNPLFYFNSIYSNILTY